MNDDEQVYRDRLKRLERIVADLDRALRGDPRDEHRSGLLARLHEQENYIARLNAVVFTDAAGNRGLVEIAKELRDRRAQKERRSEKRWTVYGSIAVALITSTALLLTNWPRAREFVLDAVAAYEHAKPPKKATKRAKGASRRSGIKRKPAPPPIEAPEPEESTKDDVSE